jgi:alpha-glucosidase/alpha-D-xyloside xylohydrolase
LDPPATRPTRGRFIPRRQTLGAAPITIYLSALERPGDALEEYVRLFGCPAMPPKWVLGYMQSHRSLAGPDEPLRVAQTLRDKRLPCDTLIYLGTGYTNGPSGWNLGHGSLEFNPLIFPRPQEALDRLHALSFKVVLHKNAAPRGLHGKSVTERSDDPLHISNYWATHLPLVKMGVDGFWPDDGDELPIEARLARHRLYYEGALKDRPGERPWSLNRNGYAGSARYGAWIWSGDVQSRWVTLANHVPVGLNFSLSVSPLWGSDVGGFFLAPTNEYSGELFVRWFQFATFTPLFRSHGRNWHLHLPWGWNTGEIGPKESGDRAQYPPESELHNAAVEPTCRQYLELRYRLLPYNYTITRQAVDTGMPLMRALWLSDRGDAEAVRCGDEYLWGPDILVAPVVESGAKQRRLYLPKGDWYDWWTNEKVAGGRWIERKVDLAITPLYVRAGAIIPLDPVRQYTSQPVSAPTTLFVHPGADGSFTLYDDDGHSTAWATGADPGATWIRFDWNDAARRLRIAPGERMQHPLGQPRVYDVKLVGQETSQRVTFDGAPQELSF